MSYYISKLMKYLYLPAIKNSAIHKSSKVAPASHIVNTTMGKYSYIGNNCTIVETEIGSFLFNCRQCYYRRCITPFRLGLHISCFLSRKTYLSKNFSNHIFHTSKKPSLKIMFGLGVIN